MVVAVVAHSTTTTTTTTRAFRTPKKTPHPVDESETAGFGFPAPRLAEFCGHLKGTLRVGSCHPARSALAEAAAVQFARKHAGEEPLCPCLGLLLQQHGHVPRSDPAGSETWHSARVAAPRFQPRIEAPLAWPPPWPIETAPSRETLSVGDGGVGEVAPGAGSALVDAGAAQSRGARKGQVLAVVTRVVNHQPRRVADAEMARVLALAGPPTAAVARSVLFAA
mmetsp:Transcript_27386/g.79892  ORF Transcript_27386/g.79892 Transcript_27386/m.79892 type:complete len:223 (+) Transcript_27386:3266-3934(+)